MKYVYTGIVIVVVIIAAAMTIKKVSPVSWGWWGTTNVTSGVALKGNDPVAYFEKAVPVAGDPAITYEWRDATWLFSSADNRDKFSTKPERYAPQFGGFCAFAVSKGFTADISIDAWHIENDQLFVFADKNVRDEWVAGLPGGSLEASEKNWRKR